jgi:diaminopimelate decarboxylase
VKWAAKFFIKPCHMNNLLTTRLLLFPDSTTVDGTHLTIAGCDLTKLADQYGTPLYIYDMSTLDSSAESYKSHLKKYYPAPAQVTYAGKAYLSVPIAQWAARQGFKVDCTGLGEISIAVKAGLSQSRILVHGVNKSVDDLTAAFQHSGTIVVDNPTELQRLEQLSSTSTIPELWLRLKPGMSVDAHAYTQTGHEDSKFGMGYEELLDAARFCLANKLPLIGIHFHQGSQFRDVEPLAHGIERALDAAREIGFSGEWHLSPGGGWGVAYNEDELPHPSAEKYVRFISEMVQTGCNSRKLPLPYLHLEPGRSLVARAGVALYRVGIVKRTANRTWLMVDGGMADNPRHALYGTKYSALPVFSPARLAEERVWIAGPYCESGDVLIESLPFPKVEEGELIAVPMSGAYHISMSSNYNGARKLAVLMLERGAASVWQEREAPEDLFKRDHPLN